MPPRTDCSTITMANRAGNGCFRFLLIFCHNYPFEHVVGWHLTFHLTPKPAPKANEDLARATFYTDCAKVKNGLALGVRVNAMVGR